jgi:hypothetical protein
MSFVSPIKEEILFDLVAVQHPGFFNRPKHLFSYERNMRSTAGMKYKDGDLYYAGGFNGGKAEEFLNFSTSQDTKTELTYQPSQNLRVLKKEPVKPLALRFPKTLADDIAEISAITGLSMNAICVELLRPAAKLKLKELKE